MMTKFKVSGYYSRPH